MPPVTAALNLVGAAALARDAASIALVLQ